MIYYIFIFIILIICYWYFNVYNNNIICIKIPVESIQHG